MTDDHEDWPPVQDLRDINALINYVGGGLKTVADQLATAFVALTEPNGQTSYEVDGYVGTDWDKTTRRILRGWAEAHVRPIIPPWTDSRFDGFKWATGMVVIDGEARDSDRHALEARA